MIKIIAGKHKNRVIPTIKDADYRPSTAKFREALFSILTSGEFAKKNILQNSNILDLFAGTGSLAFEALSRGAKNATLVDINEKYLKAAKLFAEKISEAHKCSFLKMSCINLPYSGKKYNLIFMDPPYLKDFHMKTIKSLLSNGWLEEGSIIALEMARKEDFELLPEFEIIDERKYGNSKLLILIFR